MGRAVVVGWAFCDILFALSVTVILEVGIAAFFRLPRRGLGVVAAVNLVTNPPPAAVFSTLYGLGVGYGYFA